MNDSVTPAPDAHRRAGPLRWILSGLLVMVAVAVGCDLFDDSPVAPPRNATEMVHPPRGMPRGYYAASNLVRNRHRSTHSFYKDVIGIVFSQTASGRQRQAAIDSIQGEVIGGVPLGRSNTVYMVRIPPDQTNERVFAASAKVQRLPGVRLAMSSRILRHISDQTTAVAGID